MMNPHIPFRVSSPHIWTHNPFLKVFVNRFYIWCQLPISLFAIGSMDRIKVFIKISANCFSIKPGTPGYLSITQPIPFNSRTSFTRSIFCFTLSSCMIIFLSGMTFPFFQPSLPLAYHKLVYPYLSFGKFLFYIFLLIGVVYLFIFFFQCKFSVFICLSYCFISLVSWLTACIKTCGFNLFFRYSVI